MHIRHSPVHDLYIHKYSIHIRLHPYPLVWTTIHFCIVCVCCMSPHECVPVSVLIALSEPRGCKSRCCRRSLWLSFAVPMRLSWRPSGASWPPAAVSLSSPVSGLWLEGGGGGGPWVAFLALEVGAASPGGRGR